MVKALKDLRPYISDPELAAFRAVSGIYRLILTFEKVRYKNEYVTPVTKDEVHEIITDLLYSAAKRNKKTGKTHIGRKAIRRILEEEIIDPEDLDKFQVLFL